MLFATYSYETPWKDVGTIEMTLDNGVFEVDGHAETSAADMYYHCHRKIYEYSVDASQLDKIGETRRMHEMICIRDAYRHFENELKNYIASL